MSLKYFLVCAFVFGLGIQSPCAEPLPAVSRWVEFLTQRPSDLRSYDERKAYSEKLPELPPTLTIEVFSRMSSLQIDAQRGGKPLEIDFLSMLDLVVRCRVPQQAGIVAGMIDSSLMQTGGEQEFLSSGNDLLPMLKKLSLITPVAQETCRIISRLTSLAFPNAYQVDGPPWSAADDMKLDSSFVVQVIWIINDQALRQRLYKWTQDQSSIFTAKFPAQPASGALWDDSTMDQPTLQRSLTCEYLSGAVWLWAAWDPIRDELNRLPPEQRVAARTTYLVKSWLRLRKAPPEYWLATDLEQFKAAGGNEAVLQLIDVVLREVPVVPVDMGDYLGSRSDALYSLMYKLKEYDIAVDAARLTGWQKLAVGD